PEGHRDDVQQQGEAAEIPRADHPAGDRAAGQPPPEEAGADPGQDVVVPPGVAHLHGHDPLGVGPVHEQLEREAEHLVADEGPEGQAADEPGADPGARHAERDGDEREQEARERRRERIQAAEAAARRGGPTSGRPGGGAGGGRGEGGGGGGGGGAGRGGGGGAQSTGATNPAATRRGSAANPAVTSADALGGTRSPLAA